MMLYALVAVVALFLGYYMREVLQVLMNVKKRLDKLEMTQTEEKLKPKVGYAEPKSAVELLADQQAERIKELNQ